MMTENRPRIRRAAARSAEAEGSGMGVFDPRLDLSLDDFQAYTGTEA
jgi:hypothetical protein